jgi:hypothetical protein
MENVSKNFHQNFGSDYIPIQGVTHRKLVIVETWKTFQYTATIPRKLLSIFPPRISSFIRRFEFISTYFHGI